MTGYGRGEIKKLNKHFIVEIKSTNNRFCDVKVTIPYEFNETEQEIVKIIKSVVKRGRVEVFILTGEEDKSDISIYANQELALTYYKTLKGLQQRLDLPDNIDLNMLLKFSEIVRERKIFNIAKETKDILIATVKTALKNFDCMRIEEGKAIYHDLCDRIKNLREHTGKIKDRYKISFDEYKNNLTKKIKELLSSVNNKVIDENRIALEVTLLAEKSDVSEEMTRIASHIEQFSDACEIEGTTGRKLDFILQEINREVNTIGAKCNDSEISNSVIALKEELERIREQVQNVE